MEANLLRENCIQAVDEPKYYRCDLCRRKGDAQWMEKHIHHHRDRYSAFREDIVIFSLPQPGQAQIIAINDMVERYSKFLLTPTQVTERLKVVTVIENTLNSWFPETPIRLRPYGSMVSGLAFDTSDVNIELILENEEVNNAAEILQNVSMYMEEHPDKYSIISEEFDTSHPRFTCAFRSTCVTELPIVLQFSVLLSSNYDVAEILAKYTSLDPRVVKLAACFKIWVKMCGFDRPDHGFWPPHAFHIMIIHFLQSTSPPVLPSILPSDGSMPSKEEINKIYQNLKSSWVSENRKGTGQLWLDLLAYYVKDFCTAKSIVNLRGQNLTLQGCKWAIEARGRESTSVLAVEDPFYPGYNLSHTIGRKGMYFLYHFNLARLYSYFMAPRTRNSCLLNSLDDFLLDFKSPNSVAQVNLVDSDNDDNADEHKNIDSVTTQGSARSGQCTDLYFHVRLSEKFGVAFRLRPDISQRWSELSSQDFYYTLEIHEHPNFKKPYKFCIKCRKIDHLKAECLADKLHELKNAPCNLTKDQLARLDDVCHRYYLSNKLDSDYERLHESIIAELTKLVREIYPRANLQLFGSSKNGFGTKKCDLDICMTFEDDETGQYVDQPTIINKLAKELYKSKYRGTISNLQFRTTARVPVIELRYKSQQNYDVILFDCDISLYNLLSSHKTKLLRTYCEIDNRVAILVIIVKRFFRECGICDASRGWLSSYAYTLMTLFYLQRCDPPVIPVLQELYDGDEPPERIIDGYNAWFFDDLDCLPKKWPHLHTNTLSVGNLFYGFLRFYAEIFVFDTNVVCIRRLRDLTKVQKKWTEKRIAIEDPFTLDHNLGKGVEWNMARYIRASIVLGRNRIVNQPDTLKGYGSWEDYFFDQRFLTYGDIRKRVCFSCNRTGHLTSRCRKVSRTGKSKNKVKY